MLRHAAGFIENSAPQLIIEKMNFSRDAYSDASACFGNRQRAGRQVRRIGDLLGDFQNPLAGGFVNSRTPVQSAIDCPDRNIRQLRNQMDSTPILLVSGQARSSVFHSSVPRKSSALHRVSGLALTARHLPRDYSRCGHIQAACHPCTLTVLYCVPVSDASRCFEKCFENVSKNISKNDFAGRSSHV